MTKRKRTSFRRPLHGFTLIEILIVVVIMAILAAMIVPQFRDSTQDAKANTAVFNLKTMRYQIELFKAQHGWTVPNAALSDLTTATTYKNKTCGPYIQAIPENPVTGSKAVKNSAGASIAVGDVTPGGGGWLYSTSTGEIRLDHPDYWQK
jgi:general secretion pathway protein G